MRENSSRLRFRMRLRSLEALETKKTLSGRRLGTAMPLGEGFHRLHLASVELVEGNTESLLDLRGILPQEIRQVVTRDVDQRRAGAAATGDEHQLVFVGDPSEESVRLSLELNRIHSGCHGRF